MRAPTSFLVIVGVIIGTVLLVWCLSTLSLWFLYGLVERESFISVVALRRNAAIAPILMHAESYALPTNIRETTHLFSRYVVIHGQNGESILLGIPYIKNQIGISSALESKGLSATRFGWIIEGRSGKPAPVGSSRSRAAAQFTRFVAASQYFVDHAINASFDPLGLIRFREGSYPAIRKPMAAIITQHESGIEAHMRLDSVQFPEGVDTQDGLEDDRENTLFVSTPSGILSFFPANTLINIEPKLYSTFGFLKTKPLIIETVVGMERAALIVGPQGTGIAVQGSDQSAQAFARNVEIWFAQEMGHRNPVRSAFRLPDGTIGFEYVAGDVEELFATASLGGHCSSATGITGDQEAVWLCVRQGVAALATSGDVAQSLLDSFSGNEWQVQWRKNDGDVNLWNGSNIIQIDAAGDTTQGHIFIGQSK